MIETKNGLPFGNWTEWEHCNEETFATSLKLHYSTHAYVRNASGGKGISGNKLLSKYLSGIQLGCLAPGKSTSRNFIGMNATLTDPGIWTSRTQCEGLLTSFNLQLRDPMEERSVVAESGGTALLERFDKVASVGFQGGCSNGSWIGQGMPSEFAEWLNSSGTCQHDFAVCGLRYRLNKDPGEWPVTFLYVCKAPTGFSTSHALYLTTFRTH